MRKNAHMEHAATTPYQEGWEKAPRGHPTFLSVTLCSSGPLSRRTPEPLRADRPDPSPDGPPNPSEPIVRTPLPTDPRTPPSRSSVRRHASAGRPTWPSEPPHWPHGRSRRPAARPPRSTAQPAQAPPRRQGRLTLHPTRDSHNRRACTRPSLTSPFRRANAQWIFVAQTIWDGFENFWAYRSLRFRFPTGEFCQPRLCGHVPGRTKLIDPEMYGENRPPSPRRAADALSPGWPCTRALGAKSRFPCRGRGCRIPSARWCLRHRRPP
jgi:hypothetical protein